METITLRSRNSDPFVVFEAVGELDLHTQGEFEDTVVRIRPHALRFMRWVRIYDPVHDKELTQCLFEERWCLVDADSL